MNNKKFNYIELERGIYMKLNHTELMGFMYGCMLGDSSIHYGTYECKQINKDLIMFKYNIIKKYIPSCNAKVYHKDEYIDKNGVHHNEVWILRTSAHEFFKKLERKFYVNGKRIVPKDVLEKLTPLGYAIWFADDGTTVQVGYNETTHSCRSRRVELCTDRYTKEECEFISNFLNNKFETTIIDRKRKGQFRVRFKTLSAQYFLLMIEEYFYKYFPSLLYKMDMGYRNESLKNRMYVIEEYESLYLKIKTHSSFIDRLSKKEL